jgi:hypothetical protein
MPNGGAVTSGLATELSIVKGLFELLIYCQIFDFNKLNKYSTFLQLNLGLL